MAEIINEADEAMKAAIREAAYQKAKKVHDEYEEQIDILKQRRVLVDRECGAQVKASNEAVVDNNAEIVRLNTLLEKAKNKEIKLSFKEKSDMTKQLKERRANQEVLMYEAIDLQDEYKQVMQQISDEIKALREEQGEKEIRAKYSGQYLKIVIETVLGTAPRPYRAKDVTDNHVDLRKIDVQKVDMILNQMAAAGEVICEENEKGDKFFELPERREARLAAEKAIKAAEEAKNAAKEVEEEKAEAEKTE